MKPEMRFTPIDLRTWARGEVFVYFARMAPTGYSLTVQVDVTRLRRTLKAAGCRFFPGWLWLVTRTLQEQPEAFCLAEVDGQLGCYHTLTPLYAAFHEDTHTFSLAWTDYDDSFPAFHAAYLRDVERARACRGILGRAGEVPPPNAYTVSCLPWVSFDHFAVHSYENKPYYFPSLEAGRFREEQGRTLMPLSITCHHAATDGYHISRFLERLQQEADSFARYL